MISWGEFVTLEPELAAFGHNRLLAAPCYLATIRGTGRPRVHPVTPILTTHGLYLFMEPTSPKVRDLRERHGYALHCGVPDNHGSGGEFYVSGTGLGVEGLDTRAVVTQSSTYTPEDRYVLFELTVTEAGCNGYGDVVLPSRRRWSVET